MDVVYVMVLAYTLKSRMGVLGMESLKKRRNIYMGQEYLDLEAIAVNERKRSGRDIRVSDLVRRACREFKENYWRDIVREDRK
jgi:hypothetical protein